MHLVPSSFLRRSAVATAVVALGFASFAPAHASNPSSDKARGSISTVHDWDHSSLVFAFGRPNTTTYGQVITIPAGKTQLNKFVVYMNDEGLAGTMVVRGEVYAWDGAKATGSSLFESDPQSLSFGDTAFHPVRFRGSGAPVTPGSQYVIFASVDKDYEDCTDGYTNGWGSVPDTTYGGGDFVYQNNGGDESLWTTQAWSTFGLDLAFMTFLR